MVRLLHRDVEDITEPSESFNPTMVRLLPHRELHPFSFHSGFNPTMVRLLPNSIKSRNVKLLKFQSHNGAIAAALLSDIVVSSNLVSIPQWCDCCKASATCSNISATVSIPQWCDCCHCCGATHEGRRVFQSHNGAIAAPIAKHALSAHVVVSIPQWCDCCI